VRNLIQKSYTLTRIAVRFAPGSFSFGLSALALKTPLRRTLAANVYTLVSLANQEAGTSCRCPFQFSFVSIAAVTKLYVGNLPFTATEDSVRSLFAAHGTVEKVSLITDRDTGRPRGFGFVEMSNSDASRAMQALNGADFGGRPLKVNEAQERSGGGGGNRGPRRF